MHHDITIISDLHLGSDVCRSDKIYDFLEQLNTNILVLNGDIFDSMDFRRLKKKHWRIIKKLRNISKNTKLIWISGNHDQQAQPIAHLVGASFVKEYKHTTHSKKIIILHGDRFDMLINSRPLLTKIADNIYRLIQRLDNNLDNNYYYSSKIKQKSKTLSKCFKNVISRALDYQDKHQYDAIIIGHLHQAAHIIRDNDREYVNCGCWTDKICHFVTINSDKISLEQYSD